MAGMTDEEVKNYDKYLTGGDNPFVTTDKDGNGVDPNYLRSLQDGTSYWGDQYANNDNNDEGEKDKKKKNKKNKKSGSSKGLINSIYENSLNAQEIQLKNALDEILDQLDTQKDETYANQIVANKNSNEIMANQGINSGAIAQAALSSNNALQGNLGTIDQEETRAWKDYEADLASLRASLEAERLSALLNDYYNQQDYDYQVSRDAVSDQQYADSLAYQQERDAASDEQYADDSLDYQKKQDKEAWAWAMWEKIGYATQEVADILGIYKGMPFYSD